MLPTGINVVSATKPVQITKTVKPTRYQVLPVNYDPGPYLLSPREFEVFELLCKGESNEVISSKLHIADKTIRLHKTGIFRKYKVKGITQLLATVIAEKNEQIAKLTN